MEDHYPVVIVIADINIANLIPIYTCRTVKSSVCDTRPTIAEARLTQYQYRRLTTGCSGCMWVHQHPVEKVIDHP